MWQGITLMCKLISLPTDLGDPDPRLEATTGPMPTHRIDARRFPVELAERRSVAG
jgi:hypothetical protein